MSGTEFAVSKWNLAICSFCPSFGSVHHLCLSVSLLVLNKMFVMRGNPYRVQTSSDECHVFPGSNCLAMDDVIAQLINSSVPVDDFQGVIKSYARLPYDENAVSKLKQCFLDQPEETLANVNVMVVIIHFPFFVLCCYVFV